MENLYKTLFSLPVLRAIYIAASIFFIISLYQRYIQQDEPWFGEQAYWLVEEGNVKLKSMPGLFNWTEDMIIYHKLFIWLGAGVISLVGWNIYAFKLTMLVLFLICNYFMVRYMLRVDKSRTSIYLILILMISIPELVHRSFMFRPEVAVMVFGFGSFFFLSRYLSLGSLIGAIFGGVCASLAFLTHLNALIFPVAGFLFLLFFRKWEGLAVYSVITALLSSIYFWNLIDAEIFQVYQHQLQNWPTHQDAFSSKVEGGFFGILSHNVLRLLNEHKRYFWDQDVWGISGLFLLALISKFKYLMQTHKPLTTYTLIVMACLGVLSSGHSPRYLVYLMPFMVLIVVLVIHNLSANKRTVLKALFVLFLAAHFIFATTALISILKRNRDYVNIHSQLLSSIPRDQKVLGPWEMIYNGIKSHELHSFKTYEYIEDQEKRKLSQLQLLELAADKFQMDYIILDEKRKTSKEFEWFKNWRIEDNPHYRIEHQFENYLILKRKRYY